MSFLSKLKTVKDYVLSGARAVCGAARDLSQELPEGTVRSIAGKVAGACEVLGLMPQEKPRTAAAADLVPELHAAVVLGAAGQHEPAERIAVAGIGGRDFVLPTPPALRRYWNLSSDPSRTDAEDAEMSALEHQLKAEGVDLGLPPVPRWPRTDGAE